jgi:hypothetical protein
VSPIAFSATRRFSEIRARNSGVIAVEGASSINF